MTACLSWHIFWETILVSLISLMHQIRFLFYEYVDFWIRYAVVKFASAWLHNNVWYRNHFVYHLLYLYITSPCPLVDPTVLFYLIVIYFWIIQLTPADVLRKYLYKCIIFSIGPARVVRIENLIVFKVQDCLCLDFFSIGKLSIVKIFVRQLLTINMPQWAMF